MIARRKIQIDNTPHHLTILKMPPLLTFNWKELDQPDRIATAYDVGGDYLVMTDQSSVSMAASSSRQLIQIARGLIGNNQAAVSILYGDDGLKSAWSA